MISCLLAVGKGIIKEDSYNNLFWNVWKKFLIYSLNVEEQKNFVFLYLSHRSYNVMNWENNNNF